MLRQCLPEFPKCFSILRIAEYLPAGKCLDPRIAPAAFMLESYVSMNESVLLLASASPRRRELLSLFDLPFSTGAANLDETPIRGEYPLEYVRRLAESKGRALVGCHSATVLSADTVVVLDGQVLGKPSDDEEARQMLITLRGREHTVYTAIALQNPDRNLSLSDLCRTIVPMRAYSAAEMEAYIASGDYRDKAGGYAIQHKSFHPACWVEGCYANVMGLPLCHVYRSLLLAGITVDRDIPSACQNALGITCTVFPELLNQDVDITRTTGIVEN
ncbi:MAG: Maf family protein [Anaerolineaceae bacterium]